MQKKRANLVVCLNLKKKVGVVELMEESMILISDPDAIESEFCISIYLSPHSINFKYEIIVACPVKNAK